MVFTLSFRIYGRLRLFQSTDNLVFVVHDKILRLFR